MISDYKFEKSKFTYYIFQLLLDLIVSASNIDTLIGELVLYILKLLFFSVLLIYILRLLYVKTGRMHT
jgi:hypothetical protein